MSETTDDKVDIELSMDSFVFLAQEANRRDITMNALLSEICEEHSWKVFVEDVEALATAAEDWLYIDGDKEEQKKALEDTLRQYWKSYSSKFGDRAE